METPIWLLEILKALLLATVGAGIGIHVWRRRLHGEAAFRAAHKLMLATTKLRDAIRDVRTPFIDAREFSPEYAAMRNPAPADEAANLAHVYGNRWQPVRTCIGEFREAAQEAEALFGERIRGATDKLDRCVVKLRVGIEALIDNSRDGGRTFDADRNLGRQMRERVSGLRDDDGNSLHQEIEGAIGEIRKLISRHLPRREQAGR